MKRNFTTAIRVFRLFRHYFDLNDIYRYGAIYIKQYKSF